jgi:hypothetical protein
MSGKYLYCTNNKTIKNYYQKTKWILNFIISYFLLNKTIRYFVILADDIVGCEYDGRNNSLNIDPLFDTFERKSGSSTGW